MPNVIKLLVISLFLISCKGAYTNAKINGPKTYKSDIEVTKNVTNHINDVTNNIATNASTVSNLAK